MCKDKIIQIHALMYNRAADYHFCSNRKVEGYSRVKKISDHEFEIDDCAWEENGPRTYYTCKVKGSKKNNLSLIEFKIQ